VKHGEVHLVVGADGMLGTDLVRLLEDSGLETAGVDLTEVDITDYASIEGVMNQFKPSVVINTAALTDVDGCESMQQAAFQVNGGGPANLARAAAASGAFLVHLSTDYVFDGRKKEPYVEDDQVHPLGVYGRSKAEGEEGVRDVLPKNHCIVRTQWLFGLHGRNFVESILALAQKQKVLRVVNDQHGSPTYAPDLSAALLTLIRERCRGTFHVTNSGITTWYAFAARIVKQSGLDISVEPMSSEELLRPAPRPLNAALDNARFVKAAGWALRPWEEALDDYLKRRTGDARP